MKEIGLKPQLNEHLPILPQLKVMRTSNMPDDELTDLTGRDLRIIIKAMELAYSHIGELTVCQKPQ